jgi:hypothetical protein
LVFHQSQRTFHSHGDGDTLETGGGDPACSFTTVKDPGNMHLGLETQTDLEGTGTGTVVVYTLKGAKIRKGRVWS